MSYCESCGAELPEGKLSCPRCGEPVPQEQGDYTGRDYSNFKAEYAASGAGRSTRHEPVYSYQPKKKTPERVLGTGAFFGSILLMSIPGVGLLLQIIWALGGTGSHNRRNLARAYLVFSVIGIVFAILAAWALKLGLTTFLNSILEGQVDFNKILGLLLG